MKWIVGIDEVGRGALAGPVVVAAAMVASGAKFNLRELGASKFKALGTLKDSKKLSARQRELWYTYFAAHPDVSFAVARVYPRGIERLNISGAANFAAAKAFGRLVNGNKNDGDQGSIGRRDGAIFLDGGLFLRNKKWQAANHPTAKTVVRADEKIVAVRIASIVAKVTRDRFMKKLGKQFPGYSFEIHKGYGTKAHRDAILAIGPCDAHRLTFLKVAARI